MPFGVLLHHWKEYKDIFLFFCKNLVPFFFSVGVMFIVFCSAMVYYVDYEPYAIFGYTAFFVILFMYYKSAQAHYYKYAHWWMYHVFFHILLAIEEIIILDSII